MSLGEVHEGQDVRFGGIHEIREFGELRVQLIGHGTPLLACGLEGLLGEGGVDGRQNHVALTLAGVGECITQEVNATALPSGRQDFGGGSLQALVGIGDHQLHPAQPVPGE